MGWVEEMGQRGSKEKRFDHDENSTRTVIKQQIVSYGNCYRQPSHLMVTARCNSSHPMVTARCNPSNYLVRPPIQVFLASPFFFFDNLGESILPLSW